MRGIILAAGKGSRLNGTAGESPKCLLEIGGMTLIERQIALLEAAGIDDIAVVTGYQAARVQQVCGQRVAYVENTRYPLTNSLYSLWMARPLLHEGFVVLNCDVLFHSVLLSDLLAARHENALLLAYREADQPLFGDEEMKVRVRCGRVVEMSKTMDPAEADGENLGIVKFGARGAAALVDIMDRLIDAGGDRDWAPRAFAEFAKTHPLHAIGTRGLPWIEIDFPDDYHLAVRDVLPRIEADTIRYAAPAAPRSWDGLVDRRAAHADRRHVSVAASRRGAVLLADAS
jgi:choline kinase